MRVIGCIESSRNGNIITLAAYHPSCKPKNIMSEFRYYISSPQDKPGPQPMQKKKYCRKAH